jgi:fibrillarin-like rRNA methylase
VFVAAGKSGDEILTKSVATGVSVYGEKRVAAETEVTDEEGNKSTEKIEYRYWNPFRSKLGAAIILGIENTYIKPGDTVLYLGAASGTSVSHVADMVGENGLVIAVEFAERPGVDLLNMCSKRSRVVPVIMDARKPDLYRQLVPGMVDCIFCDVAQPDPVRIVALNASRYLKLGGGCLITIKASCIDSTVDPDKVYADQVNVCRQSGIKPKEQLDLGEWMRVLPAVCLWYCSPLTSPRRPVPARPRHDHWRVQGVRAQLRRHGRGRRLREPRQRGGVSSLGCARFWGASGPALWVRGVLCGRRDAWGSIWSCFAAVYDWESGGWENMSRPVGPVCDLAEPCIYNVGSMCEMRGARHGARVM